MGRTLDRRCPSPRQLAREALASFAAGVQPTAALEALVDAILDDELVRLALEVRAGGPHVNRRAIELLARIAADVDEDAGADEASAVTTQLTRRTTLGTMKSGSTKSTSSPS